MSTIDAILRSFPLQLLFRGMFPGIFFVISYLVAWRGWNCLPTDAMKPGWIATAVFSGVVIHTIHRSITYPFVEWCLTKGENHPGQKLITTTTTQSLVDQWSFGSKEQDWRAVVSRHTTVWNDYIHLQYVSTLCIVVGALAGACRAEKWPCCDPVLCLTAFVLIVAAVISDMRRRAMIYDLLNDLRPTPKALAPPEPTSENVGN